MERRGRRRKGCRKRRGYKKEIRTTQDRKRKETLEGDEERRCKEEVREVKERRYREKEETRNGEDGRVQERRGEVGYQSPLINHCTEKSNHWQINTLG